MNKESTLEIQQTVILGMAATIYWSSSDQVPKAMCLLKPSSLANSLKSRGLLLLNSETNTPPEAEILKKVMDIGYE
jgi:hypothetical protein